MWYFQNKNLASQEPCASCQKRETPREEKQSVAWDAPVAAPVQTTPPPPLASVPPSTEGNLRESVSSYSQQIRQNEQFQEDAKILTDSPSRDAGGARPEAGDGVVSDGVVDAVESAMRDVDVN